MTPSRATTLDDLIEQLLFAFYGRVSTEDQQDPQASYDWQISRARQLIQPKGGVIIAEYFDIGHTRALPWQRRPKAAELLAVLRDPARGFAAVVIGEPQRAFYGNQFSLTFPIFEHFGVQLWVPEVGGPIDPGSEAHDLAMTLFGSQSKGERMRIKTRVRAAMGAQTAIQGRYLGGRPPYGYRLADAGAHPNPAKARFGARLHVLAPDPATAPIVRRIYTEFLHGAGYLAIAERLNADQTPSPSGYDPDRNPHRQGIGWTKHTVRAILVNPRYTGYQVWNKQRRDEVLLDIDDVAAGYVGRVRWNPTDAWIFSEQPAHQPLIAKADFDRVQAMIGARAWRHKLFTCDGNHRVYLLRKRLRCGLCQRRLQGHWVHAQPYYRCSYPPAYQAATGLAHPRTVYLREHDLLPHLDGWLAGLFDPDRLDDTLDELQARRPCQRWRAAGWAAGGDVRPRRAGHDWREPARAGWPRRPDRPGGRPRRLVAGHPAAAGAVVSRAGTRPLRLGIRANLAQFSLLVGVNALVGGMVGQERTVVPLLATRVFHLQAFSAALSFIVVFGATKALTNLFAGTLSDRLGRKPVLVAGWLVGLPVPLLVIWAPSWAWVV